MVKTISLIKAVDLSLPLQKIEEYFNSIDTEFSNFLSKKGEFNFRPDSNFDEEELKDYIKEDFFYSLEHLGGNFAEEMSNPENINGLLDFDDFLSNYMEELADYADRLETEKADEASRWR